MRLIYVLIGVILISGCKTEEKEILIYFSNSFFDDGPTQWPNFSSYEELLPETIRILGDVSISSDEFYSMEKLVSSSLADSSNMKNVKNSLDGYSENIFLVIEDRDSIYFNSDNEFFNAEGIYLCDNVELAHTIKKIINYQYYFKGYEPVDDTLYSKIKIKADR